MPLEGSLVGGKYRLIKLLGAGGMGSVYEARNIHLGKSVAIKILKSELSNDERAMLRFIREARASAAIGHPNIVDMYDIIRDDGADNSGILIVMEHLEGQSLGELLEDRGHLEAGHAAYYTCQLLSALSAAHDAGLMHRDIKPENLFLVDTGQIMPSIRLLDFGISKLVEDDSPVGRLTTSGVILGTPYFLSPEQARGQEDLDFRVDIWAAGVLLYECITGSLPFDGPNYNSVIASIMTNDASPPSMKVDGITEELDAVVLRALEKDRDERYADATEMLQALLPMVPKEARALIPGIRTEFSPTLPSVPAVSPGLMEPATSRLRQRGIGSETPTLIPTGAIRKPRRYWLVALPILLFVAIGTIAAASMFTTEEPSPESEGSTARDIEETTTEKTTKNVTKSSDPIPVNISISLKGLPEGAEVFLDDMPFEGSLLELPQSEESKELRVEAPGKKSWRQTITPTQDATVDIEMEAAETKRPGPRRRPRPKQGKRPREKRDAGAPPKVNPFAH